MRLYHTESATNVLHIKSTIDGTIGFFYPNITYVNLVMINMYPCDNDKCRHYSCCMFSVNLIDSSPNFFETIVLFHSYYSSNCIETIYDLAKFCTVGKKWVDLGKHVACM